MKKYILSVGISFFCMHIGQSHAMSSDTLTKLHVAGKCLPVLVAGTLGGAVGNAWCSESKKAPLALAGLGIAACSVGGVFYAVHDKISPRQRELIVLAARESARFGLMGFVSGACAGGLTDSALVSALAGAAVPLWMIYKALN